MTATVTPIVTPIVALHDALIARGTTFPIAAQMVKDSCAVWLLAHGVTVLAVADILCGNTGPID